MQHGKRVAVASVCGIAFGFVCVGLASGSPAGLAWPVAVQLATSRALAGFAIGVSRLRLGHWAVHGSVMGLLFSIPLAFGSLMAPDSPEFSKTAMLLMTLAMGGIYGLLTELVTTVVFKAPAHARPEPLPEPAAVL